MGLPLRSFFPAHTGWTRDQLSIGRHPPKDLKLTELRLGPIHTRILGLPGQNQNKS